MRIVSILYLFMLVACGGQGCSGCGSAIQKIPGGFPLAQRQPNVIQLRATQGLFNFISANAPAFIGKFLPPGGINIPSDCTDNPQICCNQTCAVDIGLASLTFAPQPPQTMQMTVNVNLKTVNNIPIHYKSGIISISCNLGFNTGNSPVGLQASLAATVDPATQLTSLTMDPNSININNLNDGDLSISGGIGCDILNLVKGLFFGAVSDQLKKAIAGPLSSALDGVFCEACAAAATDCPQFPNVTCGDNTGKQRCAISKGACLQRIGGEARIAAGSLLSGFSSGTAGNLDAYFVAGGYAQVQSVGGLSLGMIGGAVGGPQSSCVPMRAPPAMTAPVPSPVYQGETAPNGMPYHFGLGLSALELNLLGYGFYNTGGLCLRVGTAQVAQLSTSILGAIVPSLGDLTRGRPAAVYLQLQPQQPPTFTLGKGTFKTNGSGQTVIDDPLLTIAATDMAIDFYLFMDDRYVRFMRLTADIALPLGLEVDSMSRLVPVLGDLTKALGNLRVTNSALLAEDPAKLAALLPTLLPVLLGSINSSIAPITLPSLGGFTFTPVQITSTPDASNNPAFLGLFLKLGLAAQMMEGTNLAAAAETQAELVALTPAPQVQAELRVDAAHPSGSDLEWQYRVDSGLWHPFSTGHRLVVDDLSLVLPGDHTVEVRARVVGAYQTLDPTPAQVTFTVAAPSPPPAAAKVQASASTVSAPPPADAPSASATGCRAAPGAPLTAADLGTGALFLALGLWLLRAAPRTRRHLGALGVVLGLLVSTGACSKSGTSSNSDGGPGGTGLLSANDEVGRWLSAASSSSTLYLSSYDTTVGTLAYAEVTDPTVTAIPWEAVEAPGADVGHYTSLVLNSQGRPVIAYQDVTNGAVKLAMQPGPSTRGNRHWSISVVATGQAGARYGAFTQLALDSSDVPTVAFRAEGVQHADGRVVSQLLVAHASSATPSAASDWTVTVVDEANMSCAGLCGAGTSCVAEGGSAQQAYYCKAASGTCAPVCAKTEICLAAACTATLASAAADAPMGTGINNRLVQSSLLLFYSQAQGALLLAQGPAWKPVVLDGGANGANVGAQVGAALATDGTLHIAYQDVNAGQVRYRTWKNGTAGPVEIADVGARGAAPNQETHMVGAGASVFFDGSGNPQLLYQDQTAGTLELASRASNGTWSQSTKATGNTQSRGFFARSAPLAGHQQLLDVVYDRTGAVLSRAAITTGP